MNSTESRLSQTVDQFAKSNQLLQALMDDLRKCLNEPPDAENAQAIGKLVGEMVENLEVQARLEQSEEYLQDVFDRFPSWHPHWAHLREQHHLLHRQLCQIRDRLDQAARPCVSRELRRELSDWLDSYQQNRRREANLIHEAFVLDVGAGE